MATNKRLIKSNDEGGAVVPNFNIVTYTGDAGNTGNTLSKTVTGVGFQPDFVWGKNRDYNGSAHVLFDSVRSPENWLNSASTSAENTSIYSQATILPDGFTTGTGDGLNKPNDDFVAWCWKAGGNTSTYNIDDVGYATASAAGLDSGTIIPTGASVNTAAGFSIVSFTSNGAPSVVSTAHGLLAEPEMVIFKNRDNISYWLTYHKDIGDNGYLALQDTFGTQPFTPFFDMTSTTIAVRQSSLASSNEKCVAYCFHSVDGYQKVGSYSGGSTDTIYTTDDGTSTGNGGFKPRYVMLKATNVAGEDWHCFDSVRGGGDTFVNDLRPNTSEAESTFAPREINFVDNGFYWTGTEGGVNGSGRTYIYLAIA